ncbi:MAG TPA: hypothetical protein VFZ33_06740 [Chitinophagaceae bacterium]
MNDTPEHIKELQLKLWLSKPPEERLLQFIRENDAWWQALKAAKENNLKLKEAKNKANK